MKLKPVPKAILILAIVGGLIFGVNLVLDSSFFKKTVATASATTKSVTTAVASTVSAPLGGSIGSNNDPLKVSIVSFHGYAPALVANGGNLKTQNGSIYSKQGVNVEFVIQDNVPTLAEIFESKAAHCAWRTSDFWAQEQPNLRNAGKDGRAVMVVDNTQGGDAIIAKDASIKTVEDLADKTVALLQFTPSHGLIIDAIENSSLSARKKTSIKFVFINVEEGTAGVRAAFESGKVDAAVLWDPDLSLALRGGGHVVYSTKIASNLIYDVMVCNKQVLDDSKGKQAVQKFVDGWLAGVTAARQDPDSAVEALVATEELFKLLAKQEGKPFIKSLFPNLVWTGIEDNARILGIVGGTNHYERVYGQFDQIYRKAGALANPNSPVIAPQDSFDYSFIQTALSNNAGARQAAAKLTEVFTAEGLKQATRNTVAVTKPVMVTFTTGSAELTQRAKKTIDTEMIPFIENNGKAYIVVSGNTDSVGSNDVNKPLSQKRAKVVVDYLVKQWDFQ